jgi:putative ABC transport system permease protein
VDNRIGLEWWFFAAAGTLALLVALCTVSFEALQAARANPVDSLRSE